MTGGLNDGETDEVQYDSRSLQLTHSCVHVGSESGSGLVLMRENLCCVCVVFFSPARCNQVLISVFWHIVTKASPTHAEGM